MKKLFFASFISLFFIFSFVFFIIVLILLYVRVVNIGLAVGLTVGINMLFFIIGPTLNDILFRWLYKMKFLTREELQTQYPEIADLIRKVSTQYDFSDPIIGIIPDNNPTAFTYGSGRYNARIILTQGIFTYLNTQEREAVIAHELGHVVNRDFIVMMVATTVIQVLYEIYSVLIRAKGRKSGGAKLIALLSYVFYIISVYLVYYLSRTREYLADEFSAKITSPNNLANALIKVAYGIINTEDTEKAKSLLYSTRHLGIIDVKNAKHIGVVAYTSNYNSELLSEVMVFDKINPWAKLIELNSTHPLTGNRIERLSKLSKQREEPFEYDVQGAIERLHVDRNTLRTHFLIDLFIVSLPVIFGIIGFLFYPPLAFAGIALGLLFQIPYRFPFGTAAQSTVIDEMRNPYSSPIRGKPIALSGNVIGRGSPGYVLDEDMMYQDKSGLIFLDYNSFFGFIGNLFFALTKVKKLMNVPSVASGWFYRDMGSRISLKYIQVEDKKIRSHPILWSLVVSIVLTVGFFYSFRMFKKIEARQFTDRPVYDNWQTATLTPYVTPTLYPTLYAITPTTAPAPLMDEWTLDGPQEGVTVYNAQTVPAKINNGLEFSGKENSFANLYSNAFLEQIMKQEDIGDFTLMLWTYRKDEGSRTIASTTNNNDGGFGLFVGNEGEVYCRTSDGQGYTDSYTDYKGGYVKKDNGWHHLAIVKKGTSCNVYVDGIDRTFVRGIHTKTAMIKNPLTLGGNPDHLDQMYNGIIDEVRLYNYALTDKEIAVFVK